jgi:hypothetical protein
MSRFSMPHENLLAKLDSILPGHTGEIARALTRHEYSRPPRVPAVDVQWEWNRMHALRHNTAIRRSNNTALVRFGVGSQHLKIRSGH